MTEPKGRLEEGGDARCSAGLGLMAAQGGGGPAGGAAEVGFSVFTEGLS